MVMRSTQERLLALAVGGILAACGGRAQFDARANASNDGATGGDSGMPSVGGAPSIAGAPNELGAGRGGVLPDAGAGMSSQLPANCPAPAVDAACPSGNIVLDVRGTNVDPVTGISVEALQVPNYGTRPEGYFPSYVLPDPSTWDRSTRPAGSCVFRIHGMTASCLRNGVLFENGCPAPDMPGVAPSSFYDRPYCGEDTSPGCPIADPWSLQGDWWYLQPDGANVDLVVCAPVCAVAIVGSGGSACLRLPPAR
jgi:hypothetical protein